MVGSCGRLKQKHLLISEKRVQSLLASCENLLSSHYTTARKLSRLAGKVVSTKFVLSNIVRLKTRFLYRAIDCKLSWDPRIKILDHPEAHKEIVFWKNNIVRLNKRNVSTMGRENCFIFSDASNNQINK